MYQLTLSHFIAPLVEGIFEGSQMLRIYPSFQWKREKVYAIDHVKM